MAPAFSMTGGKTSMPIAALDDIYSIVIADFVLDHSLVTRAMKFESLEVPCPRAVLARICIK
jgi:hypothetical protein